MIKKVYVFRIASFLFIITGFCLLYHSVAVNNQLLSQISSDQEYIRALINENFHQKGVIVNPEKVMSNNENDQKSFDDGTFVSNEIRKIIREELNSHATNNYNVTKANSDEKTKAYNNEEDTEAYNACLDQIDSIYEKRIWTKNDSIGLRENMRGLNMEQKKKLYAELIDGINSGEIEMNKAAIQTLFYRLN